jgi:hypothetical protein
MAGMIEEQMAPQDEPVEQEQMQAQAGGEEMLTAEQARSQMQLPDELKDAYVRVVEAGMKVMFDPSMRERTLEFMEGPGEPAEKLAEGVAAVMAMLFNESNGTMPPQVIIPAGIELLLHAADVARKGGMEITQDTIADAMADMIAAIFRQFGTEMQDAGGMTQGGQPAPQEPTQGAPV